MIHHVHDTLEFRRAQDTAATGDSICLHQGVYTDPIDSYLTKFQGGIGWHTHPKIFAYQRRGYPVDKVVIRPTSCDFAVRLAHEGMSNIELIDLVIDAEMVKIDAVKLTGSTGSAPVHHVTLKRCEITNAPHQGVLITDAHHIRIRECKIHHNGESHFDHGVYISGNDVTVEDCSLWQNATYDIHAYDGTGAMKASNLKVIENRCRDSGISGQSGSGILLGGGNDQEALRNYCSGNHFGIQVYGDARDWRVDWNTLGRNKSTSYYQQRIYVSPDAAAYGTVGPDNWEV